MTDILMTIGGALSLFGCAGYLILISGERRRERLRILRASRCFVRRLDLGGVDAE